MKRQTFNFVQLDFQLLENDYWREENHLYRQIVEKRKCSDCKQFTGLTYKGYANIHNTLVFGYCWNCETAVLFEHLSDIIQPIKIGFTELKQRSVA